MFGFMAIAIALFLASVCVINMVSKINLTITRLFTDPLHNIFCTFTEDGRRTFQENRCQAWWSRLRLDCIFYARIKATIPGPQHLQRQSNAKLDQAHVFPPPRYRRQCRQVIHHAPSCILLGFSFCLVHLYGMALVHRPFYSFFKHPTTPRRPQSTHLPFLLLKHPYHAVPIKYTHIPF